MKRTRCFLGAFDPSGGFYREFFSFFGEWKLNVTMLMNASRPLFEYHPESGTRLFEDFSLIFKFSFESSIKALVAMFPGLQNLSTTP